MRFQSRRSTCIVASAALAILALGVASILPLDVVLYNHSPSIPTGFYLRQSSPAAPGAIVTVRAIDVAPAEARARHFANRGDRFIKRVAAVVGDEVCIQGETVRVRQTFTVRRRPVDSAGTRLSAWSGCRTLANNEVLLLGDTEDSFDGRYWGPTKRDKIEGVWVPLRF